MKTFSEQFNSILIKTAFFSIIIGALTAILKYSGWLPLISSYWFYCLIFYFLITGYALFRLLKTLYHAPRRFITTYLVVSLARMILFTLIALLFTFFIKKNTAEAISFIITLSVYYVFFSFWEMLMILPALKEKKSANNTNA